MAYHMVDQSIRQIEEIMAQEKLPSYNVEYTLQMTQNIQKITEIFYDTRDDDDFLDHGTEFVSAPSPLSYFCVGAAAPRPALIRLDADDEHGSV